ncbi:hypothetical protein A3843_00180 [Pseudovibrio exalbescens]|uniref:Uncharacterized protein n=1 Tax=Pseudovibrio exalbescens TaxID=197461 RepID=A0A1U7JCG4_9HYPH|nr:hypothetical protein A3843_00180 [Pseudovibrio exalbescens]
MLTQNNKTKIQPRPYPTQVIPRLTRDPDQQLRAPARPRESGGRSKSNMTAEGEKETERNSKHRMKKPAPHLVPA